VGLDVFEMRLQTTRSGHVGCLSGGLRGPAGVAADGTQPLKH